LPLDVAIIYTGEDMPSQFVCNMRGAYRAKLDEAASLAKNVLATRVPGAFREQPRFLSQSSQMTASSAGMNLIQAYREVSVAHSLTVLKTLHDLFQFGAAPYIIHEFIEAQNLCQDILRLTGLSTLSVDNACMTLRKIGSRLSETGVAARHIGAGKEGCLAVFGSLSSLEKVLETASEDLRGGSGRMFHCHWASWCDGNGASEGLRVDQHAADKVFSPIVGSESVTISEWQKNGEKMTALCPKEKIDATRSDFDLLLDGSQGKVFVHGEALTSADIKSAKQTIDIFERLFASPANEVRGAELPESSYRSDRNQMDSKIIRPLVSSVRERIGKKLGLEIHGGLGSQYVVRLIPNDTLRIGMVKG
jgi:hypothetical protein